MRDKIFWKLNNNICILQVILTINLENLIISLEKFSLYAAITNQGASWGKEFLFNNKTRANK